MSLSEWIVSTSADFADQPILNWKDVFPRLDPADMRLFVTSETWTGNTSVDPREIVGQWEHYAGQTWREAALDPQCTEGKMRQALRMADEKPEYYWNAEHKSDFLLVRLNGGRLYSDQGNHRTVAVKFLSEKLSQAGWYPRLVGVSVIDYVADMSAFNAYVALKKYADMELHVTVDREKLSEVREPGRYVLTHRLRFHVGDFRFSRDGRMQWLSAIEFVRFVRHIERTNGIPTRADRWAHHWRTWVRGDSRNLIFEG